MRLLSSILLVLLCAVSVNSQTTATRIYKKCLPAIVKITVINRAGAAQEGTGFFVGENTIVTCHHILSDAFSIKIETSDGKNFTVDSIAGANREADIAKFTVKEKTKFWLALAEQLPEIGEDVFIIGNPDDYDFTISTGIVSGLRKGNSGQLIQNTAPCSSGSSGSPVLNSKGQVIGVMSFVVYIGQNLNFAAGAMDIKNLKNDRSIKTILPPPQISSQEELDSIIGKAKALYKKQDYSGSANTILPIIHLVSDSLTYFELIQLLAESYFFSENYQKAMVYYELLLGTFQKTKQAVPNISWTYTSSLYTISLCYFKLGDVHSAIKAVTEVQTRCKRALEVDPSRKTTFTALIQQAYASDALFKHSLKRVHEACTSWKIAKQYGYTKDDYGLDGICK
jgi:tetratricopeptide (TPR) repeat protein